MSLSEEKEKSLSLSCGNFIFFFTFIHHTKLQLSQILSFNEIYLHLRILTTLILKAVFHLFVMIKIEYHKRWRRGQNPAPGWLTF